MKTESLLQLETNWPRPTAWVKCWLLGLALGSLSAGCLSRPAMVRQTFALESAALTNRAAPASQAVLAIRTLEVSPLFEGRSLVYRTGADRYQMDPYAGFLVSPARVLANSLRSYFRNSGAFKDVVEPGSLLTANLFLEVYVTELYGDLRPSAQPAAVLSMRMLFFDADGAKTHQPFLEKNWASRVPLPEKSAAAVVAGWNQALAQNMAEVCSDLKRMEEEPHKRQAGDKVTAPTAEAHQPSH